MVLSTSIVFFQVFLLLWVSMDELLENTPFTLFPLPFSLFIKNEQLPYFLMSWDEDNLVIIESSSQVLFLLVICLQCPDALKLVCTPLINFMVFLDNSKRMSLAYQPYTAILSKVKLGLAMGFSEENVTPFPHTEQVVCVHRERKKKFKMPKQ